MPSRPRIHAVILAGGAGERFWPASRGKRPKPFLEVVDGQSLLDATLARTQRFAEPECTWVVCGEEHARAVRRATGLAPRRVLVEPSRRNTAMAVGFAAQRVAAEDPEAVLAILPADHRIPDAAAFAKAMRRAARAARGAGALVTLGVEPTRPDTGYGYIQVGAPAGGSYPGLCRARRFVEKPDLARARRYLRKGGYLWNAGIFLFSASAILEEIERCAPELHRALAPLRRSGRPRRRDALREAYRRAPSLPLDVAVMERSRRVWTLPVDFHWSDVGTWLSLAEELGVEPGRTRILDGELLFDDEGGNLVWGDRRPIALLGVEGLAVIDTQDVLLVTKLDRSPDVRAIVTLLKKQGRTDLT
jgi:mannose-1-phosphate guanylyltransferase/mannose-6-phosphate isomerase